MAIKGVRLPTSVFVGNDLCFALLISVSMTASEKILSNTYSSRESDRAVGIAKRYTNRNPLRGVGLRTHSENKIWVFFGDRRLSRSYSKGIADSKRPKERV